MLSSLSCFGWWTAVPWRRRNGRNSILTQNAQGKVAVTGLHILSRNDEISQQGSEQWNCGAVMLCEALYSECRGMWGPRQRTDLSLFRSSHGFLAHAIPCVPFASSGFHVLVPTREFHSGSSSQAFLFYGSGAYPFSSILPSVWTLRFSEMQTWVGGCTLTLILLEHLRGLGDGPQYFMRIWLLEVGEAVKFSDALRPSVSRQFLVLSAFAYK